MITLKEKLTDILDTYEENYLEFLHRELTINRHRIEKVRKWMGHLRSITPTDVAQFLFRFREQSAATRNRYRSLLRHLLRWAVDQELGEGELNSKVFKVEREDNERTRRLNKDEETKLLSEMGSDLRDLFYAALDTGLRRGALFQLRFRDVAEDVLVVPALIQKHRRSQRIPLTSRLKAIIERRRGEPDELIFDSTGFEYRWEQAKKKAGVEGLHWHDLRGEFASRLEEAGVEVSVTSRLLGHADLSTTQRYLRPRVERFREAIDKLGV
jgi:integrase